MSRITIAAAVLLASIVGSGCDKCSGDGIDQCIAQCGDGPNICYPDPVDVGNGCVMCFCQFCVPPDMAAPCESAFSSCGGPDMSRSD